jgi:hypothetical protein
MPKEYLTTTDSIRQRHAGPRPKDRVQTNDEVGDPDSGSEAASAQEGAAAGAVVGTVVGGPLGAVVGGAVGGGAAAATEGADPDRPSRRDRVAKEVQLEEQERRHGKG